jgi:hypothetical protein
MADKRLSRILQDAKDLRRGPTLAEFMRGMQPVPVIDAEGERATRIRVIWRDGSFTDHEVLP